MTLQMTMSTLLARGRLGPNDAQISQTGSTGESGPLQSDPTFMKDGLGCPKLPTSHPDNKNSLECLGVLRQPKSCFVFHKSPSSSCIMTFESGTLRF